MRGRNVLKRTKAINAFKEKESEVRVIFLNLNSAASGTNLIEAEHIVFVGMYHPFTNEAKTLTIIQSH